MLVALALALFAVMAPVGFGGESLQPGDRAPQSLSAARNAQYESAVLTSQARDQAAVRVEPEYFPPDPAIQREQGEKLSALFDSYRAIRLRTDLSDARKLEEAAKIPAAPALPGATQLRLLQYTPAQFESIRQAASARLAEALRASVRREKLAEAVKEQTDALERAPLDTRLDAESIGSVRELLRAFVVENVKVDAEATERRRSEARDAQAPVIVTYVKGQVITPEGDSVDAAEIEALRKTGVLDGAVDLLKLAGTGVAALGAAVFVLLFLAGPRPFRGAGGRVSFVLVCGGLVVATAVARLAMPALMPDADHRFFAFALPLPAAALIAAALGGRMAGLVVAVAVGALAAFVAAIEPDIAGSSFVGSLEALELAVAVSAGGMAAAPVMARWRNALGFGVAGIAAGVGVGGTVAMFWLVSEPRDNGSLADILVAGAVCGVGSAAAAALALVATAGRTRVFDRRLIARLVNTRHPLQRRLQAEAPGTYHHSLVVATLAEQAAERIGADALLARAGALYHDIGKLGRPGYFIENTIEAGKTPHSELGPEASAAIIREHVSLGLAIAEAEGLPPAVRDFIAQHHGTRLVSYFYRRAVQEDREVEVGDFRYGGPRPQSRETAIVMLADSCEAAVRANQDRERPGIEHIVDSVFAERVAEGQFDECGITMRDLRVVAETLKEQLRAVYHPRIAYPEAVPEELARLAQT